MKKLIPAICMTLIAAALFATSTFAWFSMNTQVTATGMQVVAKSGNTFLLISGTNSTASAIQSEGVTTVALTVSDDQAKLYPSAPVLSEGEVAYLATDSGNKTVAGAPITIAGEKVTNETTAKEVTNWYTATAATSGAATIDENTVKQLTNFNGYVILKTVYLTVAAGANPANNLKVTPTFAQKGSGSDISAAKVIVTTSDGGFAVLSNSNNGRAVDIFGSNTNLTSSTVLTVKIYIYYDGNNENVYTNNAANLTGATINLAFDVTAVTST